MFEHTPVSYQSLNNDGTIADVNSYWLETLGYERDDVIGKPFTDLITRDSVPQFKKCLERLLHAGETHNNEMVVKKKDGVDLVAGLLNGKASYDAKGDLQQAHCTFMNITERKKLEELTRKSEERFHSAFDNMMEGAEIIGHDGNYLYLSSCRGGRGRKTRQRNSR